MRVFHQKNVSAAIRYYTAAKEYYGPGADPTHSPGRYFGEGAARLGLTADVEVAEETFRQLCHNIDPRSGDRLTARNRSDRRVLTDITLSAPKSVSIVWGLAQDERISAAVFDAANETFAEIENDASARVNHARGHMTLEKTRNVVGIAWLHRCARPVDGHPDPQLHVHGTFLNATHSGDDRWTAIDLSAVVRDSGYYEAMFQSRLASRLLKLGYPVKRNHRDFEIRGISRSMINKFSRRTKLINEEAARRGIRTKQLKDEIGARTRGRKQASAVPAAELPQTWRSRLSDSELRQFHRVVSQEITPTTTNERTTAGEAVDYAARHLLERESVIRKRQLLRTAILRSIGGATVDEVRAAAQGRQWISEGHEENEYITTSEVLAEERHVIAFARSGRGQCAPLVGNPRLAGDWLSAEQKTAAMGILQSSDRLQIVSGVAGSGKTSLMRETIGQIERAGRRVAVLAPTAEAAHGVLREGEGFRAHTLAFFLESPRLQTAAKGVLWIDEAGLVGMRDMARTIEVAERIDARIILSGDARQHSPVSRGATLRLLEQEAGIAPHVIRTIRRQTDEAYRSAVTDLSRGEIEEGFDKLVTLGRVHEIAGEQERVSRIAQDYAAAIESGQSALIVSPSHAEREQIVDAIRAELKARGQIEGDQEREFTVLKSKQLTMAQRADAVNYQPGEDVVEFHRIAKGGWKAGSRAFVAAVDEHNVYAVGKRGLVALPLEAAAGFDVYCLQTIQLAPGDLLRITRNRAPVRGQNTRRLNNGSLVALRAFRNDGKLELANGQAIDPGWGHFDYGATVTSYASQGKTFDRVLIAQSSLSFAASSPEQAYVSASRGRVQLDWYTDDVAELRRAITRDRGSRLASDLKSNGAIPERRATSNERSRGFAAEQLERFRRWLSERQPEYARHAS
jgi:conjugative relaxase-like TrwC/TraI family protein